MLEVLSAPQHVAAFHFTKTITARDYELLQAELDARLAKHPRIGVYADLTGTRAITPAALYKDLRYSFGKLAEWGRFSRNAVVSDSRALRSAIELVNRFVPQLQLHGFTTDQRNAALAWVEGVSASPPRSGKPALRFIDTTQPGTYAVVWDGTPSTSDLRRVIEVLTPAFETRESVRLMLRLDNLAGIEPLSVVQSGFVPLKLLGLRKLERYAIVGGPAWLPRYVGLAARLVPFEIRHYNAAQEALAWRWLGAEPAVEQSVTTSIEEIKA